MTSMSLLLPSAFCAASARMNSDNGIQRIRLARQHRSSFQFFRECGQTLDGALQVGEHIFLCVDGTERVQVDEVEGLGKVHDEAFAALRQWEREGRIKHRQTIFEGIESCVDALNGLFTGANIGKMLVKLSEPTTA